MFGDPAAYRRRQRRRAIIAWSTAAVLIALFVLGAALGDSDEEGHDSPPPSPSAYAMTGAQFDQLRYGSDRAEVDRELGRPGLPEVLTKGQYVELFPPHTDEVACTYWEISDELEAVARICFDGDRLVEKLQRDAGESELGVSA